MVLGDNFAILVTIPFGIAGVVVQANLDLLGLRSSPSPLHNMGVTCGLDGARAASRRSFQHVARKTSVLLYSSSIHKQ